MPNWINRLLGGGMNAPAEQKSVGGHTMMSLAQLGAANWSARSFASLTAEGFSRNPVVYRCVRLVAEAANRVPLVVIDGGQRVDSHPLAQLLGRPNGRQSGGEMLEAVLCDASVGDARCGVDLGQPRFGAVASVTAVLDDRRLLVSGLGGFAVGWFGFGAVHWQRGKRLALRDAVVAHQRSADGDVLCFAAPVGQWVVPGDTAMVSAGCDRQFSTCKAKFGNEVNFRGFPHIPGSDFVLRHPRSGDALDGRAVVR